MNFNSAQYQHKPLSPHEMSNLKAQIFPLIERRLTELGIPRSAYVMGGESNAAQLCIDTDGDFWSVFTSERGERFNPGLFFDPWSAGNYFVWELMRRHKDIFPDHPVIPFCF